MAFPSITTALSRAVALRLEPDTTFLGDGLELKVSPSAEASNRLVEASGPFGSSATALGLGLGVSRFLSGPDNEAFFSSPGLSILTGGGTISGTAAAIASATGRNDSSADASAVNIGLGQLGVITRGGRALWIGTPDDPFSATASAATRSLLAAQSDPLLNARLSALATVRGLEGTPAAGTLLVGSLPTFYGQPNAAVLAAADLDLDPGPTASAGQAVADARGIEGYRVMALPSAIPASPAQVSGSATARLGLAGGTPTAALPLDLAATAIGIDNAAIRGPASGAVVIQGEGLALLNVASAPPAGSLNLQSLQGIGILASDIQTNGGNATVVGMGGFAAPKSVGLQASMDAAGIDRSTVYTGSGNDTVMGRIFTEADTGVDANGDGVISPDTFLDASAQTGGEGGFDGIRNSTINTGSGFDKVYGSASHSQIDTSSGNDQILLDRARGSTLEGGFGNDIVQVKNLALDNRLNGGFGKDLVEVAAGDGNRLDGGFGQDFTLGGAGKNTFMQSNAGSALDASSSDSFAERLADPGFWATLGSQEKQQLWEKGSLVQGGQTLGDIDTMSNFDAARGDVLELSSSLGSLTQNLWDTQGALFGVSGGQLVVREGPQNSQLGVVVGTLSDIRSLGIGSPSLAYATDTRQLMFDADGDWSKGSQSLGTVNMADPGALHKSNIQFGGGS